MAKDLNKAVFPYDFIWDQIHAMNLDATVGSAMKVIRKFNDGTFKRLSRNQVEAFYLKSFNDEQFRAVAVSKGYEIKEINKTDDD